MNRSAKSGKQSAEFKKLFDDAEKNPKYWAAGFALDITEFFFNRMVSLGLTPSELSRRIGVNRAWISKLFRGNQNMTFLTIAKVCLALELRPVLSLTACPEKSTATHICEQG